MSEGEPKPWNYLVFLAIEKALDSGSKTIEEITLVAEDMGFKNPRYDVRNELNYLFQSGTVVYNCESSKYSFDPNAEFSSFNSIST